MKLRYYADAPNFGDHEQIIDLLYTIYEEYGITVEIERVNNRMDRFRSSQEAYARTRQKMSTTEISTTTERSARTSTNHRLRRSNPAAGTSISMATSESSTFDTALGSVLVRDRLYRLDTGLEPEETIPTIVFNSVPWELGVDAVPATLDQLTTYPGQIDISVFAGREGEF